MENNLLPLHQFGQREPKITIHLISAMSTEANYLRDLGKELVAIASRDEPVMESAEGLFEMGRRYAFYEVLSLMKQQAVVFELTDEQIGLEGVDIDTFLK